MRQLIDDDSLKDKRKLSKTGSEVKINLSSIKSDSAIKKTSKAAPTHSSESTSELKQSQSESAKIADSIFNEPALLDFEPNCNFALTI